MRRPRLGVDLGAVFDLLGGVLRWVGLAFLAPAAVALFAGENVLPWLAAGGATSGTGLLLDRLTHARRADRIGQREGFLVIALVWLVVPVFGALPFVLSGEPQLRVPVDAYFEAMSGFTASGGSVVPEVERLGEATQVWRQLSHWLGGMGIIVLAIAVLPRLRVGGRRLLQSELAGPTEIERFGATIRDTARRLWSLYVGLTLVATLVLASVGWLGLDDAMTPWQAFAHASSAMALGGFSPQGESVAAFAPISQWILVVVMVVAGLNFLRLFNVIFKGRAGDLARDEEVRLYIGFLLVASALLLVTLLTSGDASGENAVRQATFQATSIMTTTGFATTDYTQWGSLATMILLLLMFIGASAGSTGGSIKVVRHLLLFRMVRRDLAQTAHRGVILPVRKNGIVVDEAALRSTVLFVLLYVFAFALGSLGLVIDAERSGAELSAFDAIGAAASSIGNVGPAFGEAGPNGSFAGYSNLSTGILTGLMWLGRVEIVPVAVLLTRSFWRP
ncbi:TrkH family potassium uptake protein [Conexibacter sp. CPCC 206217]|uniref:TrkH family potassium uptake protein n=1 Tax=Conexibacter sp. CPCC 206217 TaxID=3064574 RepID=UPI0027257014|nr:TrkH family potassium uptake protein [Conexibacter sp. CPCC 206217]MDO8210463.1 TrkH family potassium uptake protein [Conexibacter sp. CPCC 206217]